MLYWMGLEWRREVFSAVIYGLKLKPASLNDILLLVNVYYLP